MTELIRETLILTMTTTSDKCIYGSVRIMVTSWSIHDPLYKVNVNTYTDPLYQTSESLK